MDFVLDAKTTALVLIDLERGILGMDTKPHAAADVVSRSAALADAFRKAGAPVVYVRVLLHEMIPREVDRPMRAAGPPPPKEMSELVPESGVQDGDILVEKRQWGAFYGTQLDQALRRRGVKTIVMGGIATNIGVESTAREAFDRGYSIVFAEDAMSTVSAEMHEFAVKQFFPIMGRVRTSNEIAQALK
jgi:nicotinamidase-related amidase